MKKQSASRSAFFGPRVLITFCALGVLLALLAFAIYPGGTVWAAPRPQQNQSGVPALAPDSATLLDGRLTEEPLGATPTPTPSPTLGNYPPKSLRLSGNTTVTPDAAPPASTTSINVSTLTDFKGLLEANTISGVVRVTDAHPAGEYLITVTVFENATVTATRTFLLTVTTPPTTCNPVTFAPKVDYGATHNNNPRSVAIGDFNRDGIQDLAVALTADQVSLWEGVGDGTFGWVSTLPANGTTPDWIVVGDFDGDGNQDLATVNSFSSNVSIFLGTAAAFIFEDATNYGVQDQSRIIKVGDFNNDHKQDLVVTNENSSTVSILLGDGAGTFNAAQNVNVGSFPYSVAVGDFGSDGWQDIAVTLRDDNQVVILRNLTATVGAPVITFASPTPYPVGNDPQSVTVGNFNPGGLQDLATANNAGPSWSVLLGSPLPLPAGSTFGLATTVLLPGGAPTSVEVGDFDGNVMQDLVVANAGSNNVSVLTGNNNGTFNLSPQIFPVGTNPASVAVGDFDGDGMQDLAVANYISNNVSVLLRKTTPNCFLAGIMDDFAFPFELTDRSDRLNFAEACGTPCGGATMATWKAFDDPAVNRYVGQTFINLPVNIVKAHLTIRMKPLISGVGDNDNDVLYVGLMGGNTPTQPGTWAWLGRIMDLPEANSTWHSGSGGNPETTFTLDLGNLPQGGWISASPPNLIPAGGSILPKLETDHYLDLFLQDDTNVDWIQLCVWTCPRITLTGHGSYCANSNPVPGVLMTLTGPSPAPSSTPTDPSGNYTLSNLTVGDTYTVTPTKAALAPGSAGINTVDVVATQRHFLTVALLPPGCRLAAADVNGDTAINTVDVVAIQRFFLGQGFGTANVGKYQFTPVSRTYTGLTSDQTAQNYDTLVFGDVSTSFVHRPEGPSQDAAGDGSVSTLSGLNTGSGEVPATVATLSLPNVAVDAFVTSFILPVTTTAINAKNKLVGFQGDFTFDERVITFQSEPVRNAGLTAGDWNVSGNVLPVLPGAGPIRTLRISAYSNDFTPLSGSGTLFELRMTRVSKAAQGTQLIWAAPPDHFIFIDADLNTQKPVYAASGGVTSSGGAPVKPAPPKPTTPPTIAPSDGIDANSAEGNFNLRMRSRAGSVREQGEVLFSLLPRSMPPEMWQRVPLD